MLAFSAGRRCDSDAVTIMRMLDGCERVHVTGGGALNRLGVDYVAVLRGGAEVFVDAKARRKLPERVRWSHGPDLQLETWSVVPGTCPDCPRGKPGWTVDESKITDLVLFTFDPEDTKLCYLVGHQHLRMAMRRNYDAWATRWGPPKPQTTPCTRCRGAHSYESRCMFVPAAEVLDAISRCSVGGPAMTDSLPWEVA